MRQYLSLIAAILLAGCSGSAEEPTPVDAQDQEIVHEGATIAPGADLAVIPQGELDFGVEYESVGGEQRLKWVDRVPAPLFGGGKLLVRVSRDRFPTCGVAGTVTANLKLADGTVVEAALDQGDEYLKYGTLVLPETASLEVWLKSENGTCVEYDSRFGANYKYEVGTWRPATVQLRADFTQSADVSLTQGGALVVDYDIQRLPNCRISYRGFPNWFIKVWARFNTGETFTKSIVRFNYSANGTPSDSYVVNRAAFRIPRAATSVQLWFENDQYPPTCHEWDSNNGQNFMFPVIPAPADRCKNTERWEGSTMVFAHCPEYSPANQSDANGCQFYVDGLGRGSFSHNGASASWLEAWLKVAPQSGTVVAAGLWSRLADANGVTQERFSFGVQTEPGTWKTGVTTARNAMGSGAFTLQPQAVAFFVDVKQASGSVDRIWLSRGGQNFAIADVFSIPGFVQNTGSGSIEWAAGSVGLFDQKRACVR